MEVKYMNAKLCEFMRRLVSLGGDSDIIRNIAMRFMYVNKDEAMAAHVLRELDALEEEVKIMRYYLLKGMGELPKEVRRLIPKLTEEKVEKAKLPTRYVKMLNRIAQHNKKFSASRPQSLMPHELSDDEKKHLLYEVGCLAGRFRGKQKTR